METMTRKAVFFDRDGVLNIDTGYPHRIDDCEMINGADQALAFVNQSGFQAFIVTNQGGIGLGLYSEDAMTRFNDVLQEKLVSHGGVISDIAFCPHHPDAPDDRMRACTCRKPKPGMVSMLAEKHDINLGQSIMIGDRQTDIEAAEAAGCEGFLFEGGNLYDFIKPIMDRRS